MADWSQSRPVRADSLPSLAASAPDCLQAEATHKALTSNKASLEHNINVKLNSIEIDSKILAARKVGQAVVPFKN